MEKAMDCHWHSYGQGHQQWHEFGNASELTNVNGTLFFLADDGSNGYELWKSDGTAAGTVLVKNIRSSPGLPRSLTNVNGTLYFVANDGSTGYELWKCDGTTAGTVMVKDIMSGPATSNPQNLSNINGMLYFSATDGTNGTELWRSDGTTAGTVLIMELSATNSTPSNFMWAANKLFFTAATPTYGRELHVLNSAQRISPFPIPSSMKTYPSALKLVWSPPPIPMRVTLSRFLCRPESVTIMLLRLWVTLYKPLAQSTSKLNRA